MHFKTYTGARKRAMFETAYSKTHKWVVVSNTNSHQVAQGYEYRLKKVKRDAARLEIDAAIRRAVVKGENLA